MSKFLKMVDLSTEEKKKEFFELLDSKKSMEDVYREFGLQYNNSNSSDLHKMANLVGFDLSIYKERQSKPKKYCLQCGKELIGWQTKFCSSSCSATYNNLRRGPREKWTDEQRFNLKLKLNNGVIPNYVCKYCGKEIDNKSYICQECKPYVFRIKTFKKFGLNSGSLSDRYEKLKEIIYQLYFENNESLNYIAKLYKVDLTTIYKVINNEFGYCRNISEGIHAAIKNGRYIQSTPINYRFISGKHVSWDNKIYFYRSSWEDDYMKKLDENKINYQYEPFKIEYYDTTKGIYRFAVPDFYLPDTNEIIEMKSYYTIKNHVQEMKDKFNEYSKQGYVPKLLLNWNFVDINDINETDFL